MILPVEIHRYYDRLINGDQTVIGEIFSRKPDIQQYAISILESYKANLILNVMLSDLDTLMRLFNVVYNNFDSMTLIDDGIYDMLQNIYKDLYPDYQVGAQPVSFEFTGSIEPEEDLDGYRCPFSMIDFKEGETIDDWLFAKELLVQPPFNPAFFETPVDREHYPVNEKNSLIVPHKYPKLVGTLDKCKFTLMTEATAVGLENDPTVKVFERDFLGAQVRNGIINPNDIELILQLKMDGMSVEADVTHEIISARSRGDTGLDLADDLTTVFNGYRFPNCPELSDSFGMKFECIITKTNLERLSKLRGRPYKNARNGVIGLVKSKDAYAYRDLLTLVPLETSLDNMTPIEEMNFINKYFTKDVYLPWAYVRGDYNSVLYQVYRFVQEAEAARYIMDYLYDGVVIHHVNPMIRAALGRENSVNKYSTAIKFNPKKKRTIFRGYTYTVGQNGVITPMAHYDPVEFLGTIHTKSSCHSYRRFLELNLAVGDVIDVTYVNDVMPYVEKPWSRYQGEFENGNTPEQFPMTCPICGAPVILSNGGAGDSASCSNFNCPDRQLSRMVNMLDKLNVKGFADASIKKLGITSFCEFLDISEDDVIERLKTGEGNNFIDARKLFLSTPIPDYRVVGALGFTNIAAETWKKILVKIPLQELVSARWKHWITETKIRGIGIETVNTLITEMPFYIKDMARILTLPNVQSSYNTKTYSIRWTGCRDIELEEKLCAMGYDANSKSGVTKNTHLLIVPYTGFSSTKMSKIGENTCIVAIDEFKKNMDYYLQYMHQVFEG